MQPITLKVGGHKRSVWKIFHVSMLEGTCRLHFFLNSSRQGVQNCHIVLRGKTPPKLGIVCERYWLLNLEITFEQHMELPPKTNSANLTKKSYMFGI